MGFGILSSKTMRQQKMRPWNFRPPQSQCADSSHPEASRSIEFFVSPFHWERPYLLVENLFFAHHNGPDKRGGPFSIYFLFIIFHIHSIFQLQRKVNVSGESDSWGNKPDQTRLSLVNCIYISRWVSVRDGHPFTVHHQLDPWSARLWLISATSPSEVVLSVFHSLRSK